MSRKMGFVHVMAILILMQWIGETKGCYILKSISAKYPHDQGIQGRWSVGAPINITFKFSCENSQISIEYRFNLAQHNETSDLDFGYASLWPGRLRCTTIAANVQLQCQRYNDINFTVEVIFWNATTDLDSRSIVVHTVFSSQFIYQTQPFVISYCSPKDLPENLTVEHLSNPYGYRDVAYAKCKQGAIFLDGTRYSEYLNVSCGAYTEWEVPSHACYPGCNQSTVEATFPAHQGKDKVWSVGSPINLSFRLCRFNSIFRDEIKFYLERNSSIIFGGISKIGNSKIYTCHTTSSNLRITCDPYPNQLFLFNISILKSRQEYNASAVQVYRSGTKVFQTSPLLIKHCSPKDLPENLTVEHLSNPYSYRDVAYAKCKQGAIFLDGTRYAEYLNVSCGAYTEWEVPSHACYQAVNFKDDHITLMAGQSMIFICQTEDSSNVAQMTIGHVATKRQLTNAWQNITVASQLNDVTANCEEIDHDGEVVRKRKQRLNVLFPPELTANSKRTLHDLEMQSHGSIVIEFRANPTLTLSDVEVLRNGKGIPNYYLVINGLNHKVVVDFPTVGENDFEEYTFNVTSHPPVSTGLVHNFSISGIPRKLTAAEASGLSVGSTIVIMAIVFLVWKKFYNAKNRSKKMSDVTVSNEMKDLHNYEEIGSGKVRMKGQGSEYLNTDLAASVQSPKGEENQLYEAPIGATTKPVEVTYE